MRTVLRSIFVSMLFGVGVLASALAGALGAGSSSASTPVGGGSGAPAFGDALVIAGLSLESEQRQAQRQAVLSNPKAVTVLSSPKAVTEREASRTEFERLDAARAAVVARASFPAVIARPAGGPPPMQPGERVVRYLSPHALQLALPGGKRAVVESLQPMAVEAPGGHREPIDLSLHRVGGTFQSRRPLVGVIIPTRLREGVQMPESGISLDPVTAQGRPLVGSEGAVDGAGVLYANTQRDTDTLVKPSTAGVQVDTVLRAADSAGQLYFRVGLPPGASLVRAQGGPGAVRVVSGGRTLALVLAPRAVDAGGAPVPVRMSFAGDIIALSVSSGGEHQWPIEVDPEVVPDTKLGPSNCYKAGEVERESSNWCVYTTQGSEYETEHSEKPRFGDRWSSGSVAIFNKGSISPGEFTEVQYTTQGESKIYEAETKTTGFVSKGSAKLETADGGALENKAVLVEKGSYSGVITKLCAEKVGTCEAANGKNGNTVLYQIEAVEPNSTSEELFAELNSADVHIAQEKSSEPTFNESESTLTSAGGRTNVLYGKGAWLSPKSGAFEVKAHDPGIGVSWAEVRIGGWSQEFPIRENREGALVNGGAKCKGVQCEQNFKSAVTYNEGMPQGLQTITWEARNATGFRRENTQLVEIDGLPPHNIKVSGWPASHEITAAQHTLTFEATDGEAPTSSSGVASISVSVDGGPKSAVPNTSCSTGGECKASGKWTLAAETLTEGVHRLIVTAVDNAGNEAPEEFTFDVRHGSPVAVGPGSVDPTSGELRLNATDVSLAGAGSVSRVYRSRNLTAGAEGPLGPQWAIGLSGGEGLTALPGGNASLAAANGGVTTFARKSNGEFESPAGDTGVTLESKEKKAGEGIAEYLLKDAKAGTTTRFEQPTGTELTVPSFASQFGTEGANLSSPTGTAIDSSGNLWVADTVNHRILKFSPAGLLLGRYGSEGEFAGNFKDPKGLAFNKSNGHLYVSDEGNNRVVELGAAGEFLEAFGWGVSDGAAKFERCTSYCRAGIAGAGEGQFDEAKALTVDSSGNVWVSEYANGRIQEFNSKDEYVTSIAKEGIGVEGAKQPFGIAISGGNIYVVEYGKSRLKELSTSGTQLAIIGKEGTGNAEFKAPRGLTVDPKTGYLYVDDAGNGRIQELKTNGEFVTKFGSAGSGPGQLTEPRDVAASPAGGIYVTDTNDNRIEEWARDTWLATQTEGPPNGSVTAAYSYKAVEQEGRTVLEPEEELAPVPTGVTCGTKPSEVKQGCRALIFAYGTKTLAKENASEWSEYTGRLKSISLKAWNPAKGVEKIEEKAVAEYAYDEKGRLRAEWDPRISPAIKLTYGYDAENRVTAVAQPGREPWLIHYGTTNIDSIGGRVLSVARPPAADPLSLGNAPANTLAPTLSSTTPAVGTTLSVSKEGSWSNAALAYNYLWEDCYKEGEATHCSPIAGAVNKSYTPQASDAGYLLEARVIAQNATGATAANTSASSAVTETAPTVHLTFGKTGSGSGEDLNPDGLALDSTGNLWVVDQANNRLLKFSSSGTFIAGYGWGVSDGKEAFETCTTTCRAGIAGSHEGEFLRPNGIAINPSTGNIYVAESENNKRVQELSSSASYIRTFGEIGEGKLSGPSGVTVDPNGNVWVADNSAGRIFEFSSVGNFIRAAGTQGTGEGQMSNPGELAYADGNIYVTDYTSSRIDEFSPTGTYVRRFGTEGTGTTQFKKPWGITVDPYSGDLYIADEGNSRVDEYTPAGTLVANFGSKGTGEGQFSSPDGIVADASGHIYVGDESQNRFEQWTATYSKSNPLPEPPVETNAVTTLEYNVSLTIPGLQAMTSTEVEKWGQKDFPVEDEAVAVFPPDKPMGWPAKEYERATLRYMDEQGRTVNVMSPSGAISTTEYNSINQVTRSLSPDNRLAAMKETGKTVEAAKKLEEKWVYNSNNQLSETLGPEHKVVLAVGNEGKHDEEAMARSQVKYFYDEGSPEGKTYGLVTKKVEDALVGSKEFDTRTTKTAYSAQNNLGWTLRRPTSDTVDSGGLNLTTTTVYDSTTGNVVEKRSPGGSGGGAPAMIPYTSFGHEGSEEGAFKGAMADAAGAEGDVWVSETGNASHIQEFGAEGKLLKSIGTEGTGELQFKQPKGLAVSQGTGTVYVVDGGNNRVEELDAEGKYAGAFGAEGSGKGQLKAPWGIAIDASKNVWVTDAGNNRLDEFSSSGTFVAAYGWGVSNGKSELQSCTSTCMAGLSGAGNGEFSTPRGIAVSGSYIYIAEYGNNRVQVLSTSGAYIRQFGSLGSGVGQFNRPYGLAIDPVSGNVYVADYENSRVAELTLGGEWVRSIGSYPQLSGAEGVAVDSSGRLWVAADGAHDMVGWEAQPASPVYSSLFGEKGTGPGQFTEPRGLSMAQNGNVFALDSGNSRIEEFSPSGKYLTSFGKSGTGNGEMKTPYAMAVDAEGNVWVADTGNNRVEELRENGEFVTKFGSAGSAQLQFKEPKGIAVAPNGNVYVSDAGNNRVQEFHANGEFVAAFGFGVSDGLAKFEICTSTCQAGIAGSGNGQMNQPRGLAVAANNTVSVVDYGNNRVEKFNGKNEYLSQFGSKGSGEGQFNEPKGITIDGLGNTWVADSGNDRVQEFTWSGEYLAKFGAKGTSGGQFTEPWGITVSSSGTIYVADVKNNDVENWPLAQRPGNEGAHYARTVYYTAKEESEIAACRNHPEWANLPCQAESVEQAGTSASPAQPVTEFKSYNMWDELETSVEKFGATLRLGSANRTKTQTYDSAGRASTSEETSTIDGALPKITDEYNKETGALENVFSGSKAETITSKLNRLGQLTSYTDGWGNVTTYAYDIDGRVSEMSDGETGVGLEVGNQTYAYDPTTGFLTKLVDSAAKTFTATYDVEGNLLTVGYPNAMTASYKYDSSGAATSLEYVKNAHCATTCPEQWFSDSRVQSIRGQTVKQTSTLAKQVYGYDHNGRLTETQETPTGKHCTTRLYGYDEESNRTSLTTNESSNESCLTEGGSLKASSYDSADNLIDAGIEYETFGNTTKLPPADAEGHAITSSYYVDNQVASEEQNGKTVEYNYDPIGRAIETKSKEGGTTTVKISHYAAAGNALTWSSESGKWSRYIAGIDGAVDAVQANEGTPVLQLHDLDGNTVGTAALSETETKLLSSYNSLEFGVPTEGKTPSATKYSWLGAAGVESVFASGVVDEGGASYVPQIGRLLQTAAVIPPGAFPNGQGTGKEEGSEIPGWYPAYAAAQSAQTMAEYIARQEQLEREERARQAAQHQTEEEELANAEADQGFGSEGGEEGEEGGEEGLTVIGSYAQPGSGGSGGGEAVAQAASHKHKRKGKKSQYNACEGKFDPSNPHEACCIDGVVTGHGEPGHPTPGGGPCEVGRENPEESEYEKCPINSERRYGPGGYYCKFNN